jgi:hypothetical protein
VTWLKQKYFASSDNRAEFFPVEWRSSLKLDGGNLPICCFFYLSLIKVSFQVSHSKNVVNSNKYGLLFSGYQGLVPQGKCDQSMKLTTNYLVPRLGMHGIPPLLPICLHVMVLKHRDSFDLPLS